jgi:hypothetical protein
MAKKSKPPAKSKAKPKPPPTPVYPRVYFGSGQELMAQPRPPTKKGRT